MKIAVVIPTQKAELTENEIKTIKVLEQRLPGIYKYCITPSEVENKSIYDYWQDKENHFFLQYDKWHGTLDEYNQMCLSPDFYRLFIDYDYIFIHQTDAVILGQEQDLYDFCDMGYDYYGAPFGNEDNQGYWVARHCFPERGIDFVKRHIGLSRRLVVGNGGVSLRRINSTIHVLEKYQSRLPRWFDDAYEDIVLSWLATYDKAYKVAPMEVATLFAKDNVMFDLDNPPFAAHGKFVLKDEFWENNSI